MFMVEDQLIVLNCKSTQDFNLNNHIHIQTLLAVLASPHGQTDICQSTTNSSQTCVTVIPFIHLTLLIWN